MNLTEILFEFSVFALLVILVIRGLRGGSVGELLEEERKKVFEEEFEAVRKKEALKEERNKAVELMEEENAILNELEAKLEAWLIAESRKKEQREEAERKGREFARSMFLKRARRSLEADEFAKVIDKAIRSAERKIEKSFCSGKIVAAKLVRTLEAIGRGK